MTDQKKAKKTSKLSRTQVVTIRFDPKLRYLIELAARKQRRTVSSFLEWVAEKSLDQVFLYEGTGYNGDHNVTIADEAENLWDVDDAERLARLAIRYPDLLTHEEQLIWKTIKDSGLIWEGVDWNGTRWVPNWAKLEQGVFPQLRDDWETFKKVASGELPRDQLPRWELPNQWAQKDDDIPF